MSRRAMILGACTCLFGILLSSLGVALLVDKARIPLRSAFQPSTGKIFVLVIGSDARRGNPDNVLADAIHLIGIDGRSSRGGILNIPRDSWVEIPGHGMGKINESLFDGGPELVVRTVENLTGIHIDHWVLTGFDGFTAIVDDLRGVGIKLSRDIFDPGGSGAHLRKGRQKLSGGEALAYVRTRHSFPDGDIDRTANQARFLLLLLQKMRAEVRRDPSRLLDWMAIARRRVRTDLAPPEIFRLAVLARQVRRADLTSVTLPVSLGFVGEASVVFISPNARAIYARFRKTARL